MGAETRTAAQLSITPAANCSGLALPSLYLVIRSTFELLGLHRLNCFEMDIEVIVLHNQLWVPPRRTSGPRRPGLIGLGQVFSQSEATACCRVSHVVHMPSSSIAILISRTRVHTRPRAGPSAASTSNFVPVTSPFNGHRTLFGSRPAGHRCRPPVGLPSWRWSGRSRATANRSSTGVHPL